MAFFNSVGQNLQDDPSSHLFLSSVSDCLIAGFQNTDLCLKITDIDNYSVELFSPPDPPDDKLIRLGVFRI